MERLVSLYLLTVCDIRATGPKIWNAWKAQLLEDLFYSTARFLKGKGIDRDLLVSRRRKDALRLTRFTPEQRDRINKFWDNFDVAYFMKHSVRNIVWHAKVLLPHLEVVCRIQTAARHGTRTRNSYPDAGPPRTFCPHRF